MKVFELKGGLNGYMTFVVENEIELYTGQLSDITKYNEVMWNEPPSLILRRSPHNQKKYKGKKLKVPDIGYLTPGSVIVNEATISVIGEYLKRFGYFVPLKIEGEIWYSYVVTNVLKNVIDMESSVVSRSGTIKRPAFHAKKLPEDEQVFKTLETGLLQIFYTENSEQFLQKSIMQNSIDAGELKLIWEH